MAIWGYLVFALAAGAMLPIQFGINAQLAAWVGSPVRAAFVSFVVGALGLAGSVDDAPHYRDLDRELDLLGQLDHRGVHAGPTRFSPRQGEKVQTAKAHAMRQRSLIRAP